jgi:predicted phage replisome organizer
VSDVKWIKITTDIFDDEKMYAIETMPDGQLMELIWFKLLCLAGKCNNHGFLMINNKIAYTDEMLSMVFRVEVGSVTRALTLFQQLEMIEVVDNAYMIANWDKHQNEKGLEDLRAKQRERTRRCREKQKQEKLALECKDGDVTCNVTVTSQSNVTSSYSNSLYIYNYNTHSNKENLIYILDNTEEYKNIKQELKQAMIDWMEYKDELKPKAKNHYVEKGLKGWITTTFNCVVKYGVKSVITQINKAISNQWVGTNYDMLEKGNESKWQVRM